MNFSVFSISSGPMIGESMLFVPINVVAFFLTLLLVMKIGKGKISIPIIFIGLGFLTAGFFPVFFGTSNLWVVPILQTLFGILGILALMHVFGVFSLLFPKASNKE